METNSLESNPNKIFHAKTFFITWLVMCLISLAGFLWSAAAGDPIWFIICAPPIGPGIGIIMCALRGM